MLASVCVLKQLEPESKMEPLYLSSILAYFASLQKLYVIQVLVPFTRSMFLL